MKNRFGKITLIFLLSIFSITSIMIPSLASSVENCSDLDDDIMIRHGTSNENNVHALWNDSIEKVIEKEAKKKDIDGYSVTIAVEQPNKGSYDAVDLDFS